MKAGMPATSAAPSPRPVGWRRLLPRHLRGQILMLLGTVMLGSLAGLYLISSHRAQTSGQDATRRWAEAVATTAASAAVQAVALEDDDLLESGDACDNATIGPTCGDGFCNPLFEDETSCPLDCTP